MLCVVGRLDGVGGGPGRRFGGVSGVPRMSPLVVGFDLSRQIVHALAFCGLPFDDAGVRPRALEPAIELDQIAGSGAADIHERHDEGIVESAAGWHDRDKVGLDIGTQRAMRRCVDIGLRIANQSGTGKHGKKDCRDSEGRNSAKGDRFQHAAVASRSRIWMLGVGTVAVAAQTDCNRSWTRTILARVGSSNGHAPEHGAGQVAQRPASSPVATSFWYFSCARGWSP